MGTDVHSISKLANIVETLRRRDHKSTLPSQVKLVCDNASSRRDIDFIYDVLLKWFEEHVQRIAMARPKKVAIHCDVNHWMGNPQDWSKMWVPSIQTRCIVNPSAEYSTKYSTSLDTLWKSAMCSSVRCIAVIF